MAPVALLRRLRQDHGGVAGIAAVVLVTSFLAAAAPRHLDRISDSALRRAVADANPVERNLEATRVDRIPPGDRGDPLGGVAADGERLAEQFPPQLREVIAEQTFVVATPRYRLAPDPGMPASVQRFVTLSHNQARSVRIERGRAPGPTGEHVTLYQENLTSYALEETPASFDSVIVPVLETAISAAASTELEVDIGARLIAVPDDVDELVAAVPPSQRRPVLLEIVGLLTVDAPPVWPGDERLDTPLVLSTDFSKDVFAIGAFTPDAYADVRQAAAGMGLRYSWRYVVDPQRLAARALPQLADDLAEVNARFGGSGDVSAETALRTGLFAVFERYGAQRRLAEGLLALAGVELFVIAATVVGLAGVLLATGRRAGIATVRSRGASAAQVLSAQLAEALLVVVPAAALGYGAAVLALPTRPSPYPAVFAAAVGVAATALLVAAALPAARRQLRTLVRDEPAVVGAGPRRLVVEGLLVTLAAGGVLLLRRRGLAADDGGLDPFLALIPALVVGVASVALLRVYPWPARALASLAARGRALVLPLALQRAAREPAGTALPLLVVLLAMSMASFISTVLFTVDDEQARTAWERVGAAYRLDAPEAGTVVAALPAAPAAAEARDLGPAVVREGPVRRVRVVAVDTGAYAEVVRGTPVAQRLALDVLGAGDPLPVLVADPQGQWRVGQTFSAVIGGNAIAMVVRAAEPTLPGLAEGGVLVSLDALRAAVTTSGLAADRLYLPAGDAEPAQRAVPGSTLHSQEREYRLLRDEPLAAATMATFASSVLLATAYSALAITLALVLTARGRARDLGYLRTLGLSDGQATRLVAVEVAVPAAVATLVGLVLGIGSARLTAPGLPLSAFTGSPHDGRVHIDAPTLALAAAALAAVVALTVLAMGWFTRRMSLSRTLRMGDA